MENYLVDFNNKNEVIGYLYNSTFIFEGIREIGKVKKQIVNYTYDQQGRKILTTDTSIDFPYKMKYTYKDF